MRSALLMSTLIALACAGVARADEIFGPAAVWPAAKTFRIGTFVVTSLHDAQYVVPNDAKTFGVDAGAGTVGELLRSAGAPTDRITLSVNALLVRTGGRVLLIDSGLGPKAHGTLLKSLAEAGVSPRTVTDVLITHSHGDHVGGLLDADGKLAFPKAVIRMAAAEWTWLQKSAQADLVIAIGKHVHTFEPGALVAPGVQSVALSGHTPGHVGYLVFSGKDKLLDIGDLAHSSIVSLLKPEWIMGFDTDAAVSRKTRTETLARLAREQRLIFSPHFPYPGVGHIEAAGDAFAWKPGTP